MVKQSKYSLCFLTIVVLVIGVSFSAMAVETDALKSWQFTFGDKSIPESINVSADMEYTQARGYGFLGLGKYGYQEDVRSDGFRMVQGQEIVLQNSANGVGVTDPAMPIRFAVFVEPNTYYKVKVTLTGIDQNQAAVATLFTEKRHLHLTEEVIPAGQELTYEVNVNVQNVHSKTTGVYQDTMLNIVALGENVAISKVEVQQLAKGRTLWVLGDSTVCDQNAPLPYFPLQNYAGVGQALGKYLGPDIALSNHGEGGLETNSSKNHFNNFKERIQPGDIVFFEFGHNHKEANGDQNYYNNIPYYYDFVHNKGAKFIVVGPIDRHNLGQYNAATNTWSSTLQRFSKQGQRFVQEQIAGGRTDIAFIDLNQPSLQWFSEICEQLGKTAASTDYYFRGAIGEGVDGTHPNDAGVDNFAWMFFEQAKAVVAANPNTADAKVFAYTMEGLRDGTPYQVPESITSKGRAPNAAYPIPVMPMVRYEFPLVITDVALADNGQILSMSVKKQEDFPTYGRGIVEVYTADGNLKGVTNANEQIDNTVEGTQTVTFTTDLTVGENETLKGYVWGYKDEPGNPLTQELAAVYTPTDVASYLLFDKTGENPNEDFSSYGLAVGSTLSGVNDWVGGVGSAAVKHNAYGIDQDTGISYAHLESDGVKDGAANRGSYFFYKAFTQPVTGGRMMVEFDIRYNSGTPYILLLGGTKADSWPPAINPFLIESGTVIMDGKEIGKINQGVWTRIKYVLDMENGVHSLSIAGGTPVEHKIANYQTTSPKLEPASLQAISFQYRNNATAFDYDITNLRVAQLKDRPLPDHNFSVSIAPGSEAMGTVTGGGVYPKNTVVTAMATANPGYEISYWTNAQGEMIVSPDVAIRLFDDVELVAHFQKEVYDPITYAYREDYTTASDAALVWKSPNAQGNLTLETSSDLAYGKYIQFAPGNANSRSAYSWFPASGQVSGQQVLEFNVSIRRGNNHTTQFAVLGKGASLTNNARVESGYVVKFDLSAGGNDFVINDTVSLTNVPAGAWLKVMLKMDFATQTADLLLTNDDGSKVYFDGEVKMANNVSALGGLFILGGRYNSVTAVDNIKVYDQSFLDVK